MTVRVINRQEASYRGVGRGRFCTVAKCRFGNWRYLLRRDTSQLGTKHQSAAPHHEHQRLFPREPLEVTQYSGNEFQSAGILLGE
jgi:hypothetical protein